MHLKLCCFVLVTPVHSIIHFRDCSTFIIRKNEFSIKFKNHYFDYLKLLKVWR